MRAIGPELGDRALQIGRVHVEGVARLLGDGGQELLDGVGQHDRELVAAQLGDRLGDRGDGVVVVDHRPVPGAAAGGEAHPHHALLGGLDQVERALAAVAARHRQRESADLADRLGDALEQVGPVLDQPLAAVLAAGLLVGDEREHQVARRDDAGAFEVPGDRDHHADHVLHVDRAAAPHVAVLDGTGERVHAPVGGLGGHDVEVAVHQQGATRAVGAVAAGRTRCRGLARRTRRIRSRSRPPRAVRPPSGRIRPRPWWSRVRRCWRCRTGSAR